MKQRAFIHGWRWALAHAGIPHRHEALLGKVAAFWSSKDEEARPSQARLATMMCTSERTVERLVADLKRAGWLTVEKRASSSGRANVYRLHVGRRFDIVKRQLVFLDELDWPDTDKASSKPPAASSSKPPAAHVTRLAEHRQAVPECAAPAAVQEAGERNTGWSLDAAMTAYEDF